MHFFSIVATALISTAIAARGSPLPPSTLHQRAAVAAIKAGITDAKAMANVALTTLKGKDMNKSNGFFWLFGGSSVSATEIADRFQFVNNLGTPDEVTSLQPEGGAAYANTVNIGKLTKSSNGVVPTVNLMRFGTFGLKPEFLWNTESFTAAAARLKAGGNVATSAFQFEGQTPLPFIAFTLVHEVQHCTPMLDGKEENHFVDQKVPEGKPAYGIGQVASNPEFFDADCVIGEQLGGVARSLDLFRGLQLRSLFGGVTKSKAAPVIKPAAAPVAKPVAAPVAKPVASPAVQHAANPVPAAPIAKPPTIPATKPPASKPVVSAAPAKPSSSLTAAAAVKSAGTCKACLSCQSIKNGIPGADSNFLQFDDPDDV
ncbi:hypothetical protein B0H10DRAFT_2242838 [Mycena sp. CBHHK59/15]|nr:hypothetical protein B0H10DRAFT_2242838 [Mycena sp. CBHHK59/15]